MSLQIGIVGLPNVGKSTLFNALLKTAQAQAANFPFTTIEPNVGVVAVPDERLDQLAAMVKPEKVTPATVRFVDIAGLVRGASTGEGLGNKFLAHIREVDAIAMVVRFFVDPNVTHVAGKIDPLDFARGLQPADDIRTIQLELILADLATIQKRIEATRVRTKTGDTSAQNQLIFFEKIERLLTNEQLASEIGEVAARETLWLKELQLLSAKPLLYVANVSEDQIGTGTWELVRQPILPISAKIEAELAELADDEQVAYLKELNLREPGRNALIRQAYETLGLATYFTAGPKEVRAWTIPRGSTAPQAAGVIHTDFERGFIAAEVIPWEKLLEAGGWNEAKGKGWVRTEGKDYVFTDGDVALFRFNV